MGEVPQLYESDVKRQLCDKCKGLILINARGDISLPGKLCSIPGLPNDSYEIQNENHEQLINLTIPRESGFYGNMKYSSCEVYSFTNTSDLWSPDVTNMTVPCQEWVYDKTQYISTVAQSMNFVCDKKSLVSHARMVGMSGQLVGSLVNGPLSDVFGRRPVIVGNAFLLVVLSITLVWVNSVPLLFLFTFFIYQCSLAQYLVSFVFGMEIVAPSKRMWTGITMNLFWSAGNLMTALTAYLMRDWKIRQLVVSVPTVVFVYLYFIPESPRWLLKHGRKEEAKKIMLKMARRNGVTFNADVLDVVSFHEDKEREPFWYLLRSSIMIRRVLILCFSWFAVGMSFYGLSMNVTNLSGSIYLNFFLFVFIEVFAYLICLFLIDRTGRRRLLCLFLLATGIACVKPLVPVLASKQPNKWAINIFAITGNTCASAAMAAVYAFTAELMPTTTRNFGMSLGSLCGRIGSLIAPYVVDLTLYVTGRFGQILPMLVFGGVVIVAGFLSLLLPETLNMKLPETVKEAERLGTKSYDNDGVGKSFPEASLSLTNEHKL